MYHFFGCDPFIIASRTSRSVVVCFMLFTLMLMNASPEVLEVNRCKLSVVVLLSRQLSIPLAASQHHTHQPQGTHTNCVTIRI